MGVSSLLTQYKYGMETMQLCHCRDGFADPMFSFEIAAGLPCYGAARQHRLSPPPADAVHGLAWVVAEGKPLNRDTALSCHRALVLVVAATAGLAWVAGCGDGATEPPPPDPPRPTTVAVTPATAELTALGATEQLRAEVRDQNGQVMTGATVTWASGSAAVATVDPTRVW